MKKLSILPIFLLINNLVWAQANHLIVFSEENYPFTLVVNGLLYNEKPETSVKAQNLTGQSLKVKIIFQDVTLGEVDKTAQLPSSGKEYTYKIKRSASGDWVFKLESSVAAPDLMPVQAASQPAVGQPVQTTTTTTTGTYYNASSTGTSSSFSTNAGGGMSVNVTGIGINPNVAGLPSSHDIAVGIDTYNAVEDHYVANEVYVMSGYNGPIGCPWPMDAAQFATARQTVEANSWDETKLTVSKQIIGANCLTCAQVRDLMGLMGWEQSKLDLAKFAYGYTYDLGNYYQLNDAFEWESSVTELNDHILGR